MKKAYKTPEMKTVSLRKRPELLQCSGVDGDTTPCIYGPLGMEPIDNPHNG